MKRNWLSDNAASIPQFQWHTKQAREKKESAVKIIKKREHLSVFLASSRCFLPSVYCIAFIMVDWRPVADEYFRSINPIARRIFDDIKATKENYESAWNYLSNQEQTQVLDESLIYPDAVLKYSMSPSQVSQLPSPQGLYACKILQDETGAQWRDEHSAPFSWKTSSQLQMDRPSAEPAPAKDQSAPAMKKRPPVPPPKPPKPQLTQSVPSLQDIQPELPGTNDSPDVEDQQALSNSQVVLVFKEISPHNNIWFLQIASCRLFYPRRAVRF